MSLNIVTYYKANEIPELPGTNIFHSKELFLIYEATPTYAPVLIVAYQNNQPIAKLFVAIRKRTRFLPPLLIQHCVVFGTGEYMDNATDKEAIFGQLLELLTKNILRNSYLVEFRNLENSLFGYKYFRINNYFPVNWLRVRNSLHGQTNLEDRFSESRRRQIRKGIKNGASIYEANSIKEIRGFSKMLRINYSSKVRKHFPSIEFFEHFYEHAVLNGYGKVFIVKYKEKIIGGSVCIFSESTSYLWFSGGMKKTYKKQYPCVLATWKALDYAHKNGYRHLEFVDVGLPFRKHGYREFVLRFGGKQSSTRRWYRFSWNFLNNLMMKIYS